MNKTIRNYPGFFISFEGGEGAGKSTQIRNLTKFLRRQGYRVVLTLEPGGTELGKKIREILLNPKNKNLSLRSELLLYLADRAQHVDECILPALLAGKVVISDRYTDSTDVYQGICRGFGLNFTTELNQFATMKLYPDVSIFLDIPEKTGMGRVQSRIKSDQKLKGIRRAVKLDRLEREKISFHRRVRLGFIRLAKKYPSRVRMINANRSVEEVEIQVQQLIRKKLKIF